MFSLFCHNWNDFYLFLYLLDQNQTIYKIFLKFSKAKKTEKLSQNFCIFLPFSFHLVSQTLEILGTNFFFLNMVLKKVISWMVSIVFRFVRKAMKKNIRRFLVCLGKIDYWRLRFSFSVNWFKVWARDFGSSCLNELELKFYTGYICTNWTSKRNYKILDWSLSNSHF